MYAWIATLIFFPWYALLVAWVIASMISKPTLQQQKSESRLLQIAIQVIGLWMIFGLPFWLRGTALSRPLLPQNAHIAILGLCMTMAGMLLCVWSRVLLGRNRTGLDISKQNRAIFRRGPYRIVRHPLYAGVMIATLGTAIVFTRAECFAGVMLVAIGFWMRIRLEDQFMQQNFGEDFAHYRNEVRTLIPFIF